MPVNIIVRHDQIPATLIDRLRKVCSILLEKVDMGEHSVNIVLIDDEEMGSMNYHYRNIKGPTNVLSFSFNEGVEPALQSLPFNELGDIVISFDTAKKEAETFNQTLLHRLAWLLTHGLLHLLGYDHEISEQEAERMYDKEKELLDEQEP